MEKCKPLLCFCSCACLDFNEHDFDGFYGACQTQHGVMAQASSQLLRWVSTLGFFNKMPSPRTCNSLLLLFLVCVVVVVVLFRIVFYDNAIIFGTSRSLKFVTCTSPTSAHFGCMAWTSRCVSRVMCSCAQLLSLMYDLYVVGPCAQATVITVAH